jgi:hypothetical protein
MIKEEQHEEISEEDENDEEQSNSSPYNRRDTLQMKKFAVEPNSDQLPINSQSTAAYPMNIDNRPSNRLGCSRAFHQTKENWKDNGGSSAHSHPRNHSNMHH